MHYINRLLLTFAFCFSASGKVVPFIPKYRLENLKAFVDSKNLYYFNNARGEFIMNKGFKSFPLIKSKSSETNYNAYLSNNSEKILIEEISNYLTVLNIRKNHTLWLSNIGSKKATKIGSGINPQFHLGDQWISFYEPNKKIITIINANTKETYLKFRVANNANPYFVPEITMSPDLSIIYTQINSDLEQEVILMQKKKKTLLKKSTSHLSSFHTCSFGASSYIKEAILSEEEKSSLSLYAIEGTKTKRIFSAKGHYPGGLYCLPSKRKLAFTKKESLLSKENPLSYELMVFDTKKQKINTEKKFKGDISLFLNGEELLLSYDSKVFIYNE